MYSSKEQMQMYRGAMDIPLNHLSEGKTANNLFVNADGSKITSKQLGDLQKYKCSRIMRGS